MIEDQALVDIGLPQVFLGLLEGCAVFEQPEDALRRITGIGSEIYLDWFVTGLGWTIAIALATAWMARALWLGGPLLPWAG